MCDGGVWVHRYGHLEVVELLLAAPGIMVDQLNQVLDEDCSYP